MSETKTMKESTRLYCLDMLRGLAIFGMIWSGQLPEALPRWMHHDQFFKDGKLIVFFGLTWVDIVFPFFLFCMGAAIPFALSRRMDSKEPLWKIIGHILWRGLLITGFAYYLGNSGPWSMGRNPDEHLFIWFRTILGFICLLLFLARFPTIPENRLWVKNFARGLGLFGLFYLMKTLPWAKGADLNQSMNYLCLLGIISLFFIFYETPDLSATVKYLAKGIGVIGLLAALYYLYNANISGFTRQKNDIIILILARVYITASIIWLISRTNLLLRLSILAGIFALRLHSAGGGITVTPDKIYIYSGEIPNMPHLYTGKIMLMLGKWVQVAHMDWFYSFGIINISVVAVFGTIIGDILYQWVKSNTKEKQVAGLGLSTLSISTLLIALPAITAGGLYFLQTRFVLTGLLFTVSLCILISILLKGSKTPMGQLLRTVFNWAVFFLVIGYFLEPHEGGIRKDPSTLSYYFVTLGMATSLLLFFFILVDGLSVRKGLFFLQGFGSNPMLAYIMGGHFIFPLMHITLLMKYIDGSHVLDNSILLGTLWSLFLVSLVIGVVYLFTRKKIYMRV